MAATPVILRNYFYQLSDFIFLVWSFSQTIFTNKIPDEIISINGLKSSAYIDSTPRYVTRRSFTKRQTLHISAIVATRPNLGVLALNAEFSQQSVACLHAELHVHEQRS